MVARTARAREPSATSAITDALHQEYAAVIESGLLVQTDDAFLASYYDVMVPPLSMEDYRKWAARRVDALNHALRGSGRAMPLSCLLGKLERPAY